MFIYLLCQFSSSSKGFISFANAFTGLVSFVLSYLLFPLAGFGWFPPSLFPGILVTEGWQGRWSGMAWWDGYLVYFLFLSDIFFSRWKRNYLMIFALRTLSYTSTPLVAHWLSIVLRSLASIRQLTRLAHTLTHLSNFIISFIVICGGVVGSRFLSFPFLLQGEAGDSFFSSDFVLLVGGGAGGREKERLLGLGWAGLVLILIFFFFSCTVPAWFFSFFLFSLIFFSPGDDDEWWVYNSVLYRSSYDTAYNHFLFFSSPLLSFPFRVGFCLALRFASTPPRASFRQFLSATTTHLLFIRWIG